MSLLIFALGIMLLQMLRSAARKRVQYLRLRSWKKDLSRAFTINIIAFSVVCIIFENIYGFITDDVNYSFFPDGYVQPALWEITNATSFMLFLTWPFRSALHFDIPSLHVMYACMGFVGSALYFKAYAEGIDLKDKALAPTAHLAFLALLCFPNLMAWGRFFGKDSLVFTLTALFVVASRQMLKMVRFDIGAALLAGGAVYFIQYIRPHVAAALVSGLGSGLAFALITQRRAIEKQSQLVRIVLPIIGLGVMATFGTYALTRLTGKTDATFADAQQTIMISAQMGSFGGSTTNLAAVMEENPTMIFSPAVVAMNVFNLYFAPMPWQITGGYQVIAFVSNMLLFFVLAMRWRFVKVRSAWTWFLVFSSLYLTVILSFLTGNIGLAMRQKIIVLPFLFMLLFDVSEHGAALQIRNKRRSKKSSRFYRQVVQPNLPVT
jgi:hypothetical protein